MNWKACIPGHWRRLHIGSINGGLREWALAEGMDFVDIAPSLRKEDGTLPPELAGDSCHPSGEGSRFWADALQPFVEEP